MDGVLYVMLRRPRSIGGTERAGLFVAAVIVVIPATVAKVDPAHIGHVPLRAAAVAQYDELLVM